jgi:molybdopterin converting factor small subunit
MRVFIRFLAFDHKLPETYTELILPDDTDVDGLLKAAEQTWALYSLAQNILVASNGRLLQRNEKLQEGQEISLIGQIIGG